MNILWSQHRSLIWRQRQLFSVRLLFASLVLAVATVVTILSITGALKDGMQSESSNFIAGDRQLVSPRKVDGAWLDEAERRGLSVARSVEFSTMLRSGRDQAQTKFQLVSVKAVDGVYPLKGELLIERGDNSILDLKQPAGAEVWLQKRLFGLLDVEISDQVIIGEHRVAVSGRLVQEPDTGFQLAGFAPRVMMRLDELALTEVVQPGSRVTWRYYFAGDEVSVREFEVWLKPQLLSSQKWQGVREGRPAISDALDKADNYLLLGGSLAVLLAALAIAISAKKFVEEQAQMVAIVKAMGARADRVFWQYISELLCLLMLAFSVGVLVALIIGNLWIAFMRTQSEVFAESSLMLPGLETLAIGFVTALVMFMCFAVPQLRALRDTPSMRVLRKESGAVTHSRFLQVSVASVGVAGMLWLYSGDWLLVVALLGVVGLLLLVVAGVSSLLMRWVFARLVQHLRLGSALRHSILNLQRHPKQSLLQLSIFTVAIYLFATLFLARTSLLEQWQSQLPDNAPNHFLINVAPYDLDRLKQYLSDQGLRHSGLYPMVRGRLTHINDQVAQERVTENVGALNRELNLTWSNAIPDDNELVSGLWWSDLGTDIAAVSIESDLAGRLKAAVGDRLRFSIGGRTLNAEVTSIRTVQWDSMRPNFYMIFPEAVLEDYPATFITSFYLDADKKDLLNGLSQNFPTVSILELDQIIGKVKAIVDQVSRMIELLLAFIFSAALLVLAALVASSRQQRIHESVLLRTLGASRRFIFTIQFCEFLLLGLVSGVLAVLGAELSVALIKAKLFSGAQTEFAYRVWVLVPLGSAALLAWFGMLQTRSIPNTSPAEILRDV